MRRCAGGLGLDKDPGTPYLMTKAKKRKTETRRPMVKKVEEEEKDCVALRRRIEEGVGFRRAEVVGRRLEAKPRRFPEKRGIGGEE